jgi:hypothetical protein
LKCRFDEADLVTISPRKIDSKWKTIAVRYRHELGCTASTVSADEVPPFFAGT